MIKLKLIEGKTGHGVPFIRIRHITDYLVGDVARFNDAKYAELNNKATRDITRISTI